MPKRHPRFYDCVRDLRLVFRQDGDVNAERQSNTASKEKIASKIASFREKWEGITDEFGNHILISSSMQAISNLLKHINTGCLSDIPPGMGTNRNERFHRHLKSLIHRTCIGILLAYALLTVLIHAHNNSEIIASRKFVSTINARSCLGHTDHRPVGIYPSRSTQVDFHDQLANSDQWEQDNSIDEVPASNQISFYDTGIAKYTL